MTGCCHFTFSSGTPINHKVPASFSDSGAWLLSFFFHLKYFSYFRLITHNSAFLQVCHSAVICFCFWKSLCKHFLSPGKSCWSTFLLSFWTTLLTSEPPEIVIKIIVSTQSCQKVTCHSTLVTICFRFLNKLLIASWMWCVHNIHRFYVYIYYKGPNFWIIKLFFPL